VGYTDLVRRLGHHRWFARLGRALVPLDRAVQRASRGRWSVVGRSVLPELLLTTTGRRSGVPRTVPLLYARDGDSWVVTASNWGQATHPAWSANLLAQPLASISIDGRSTEVRAELADGAERERLWPLLTSVWPAYDSYATRTAREIRVFRLSPVAG
jgi:deazaflavin-dependent oxidoreductase (nitroreductase family)